MLVLGRKPGEGIIIGDNIKVFVIKVDGEMKLTIDAPRDVRVLRSELYEQMQEKAAVQEFLQ